MSHRQPLIGQKLHEYLTHLDYAALTASGSHAVSLHFEDIFCANVSLRQDWLEDKGIGYQIAFALKATGESRYVELCKQQGIGVDVASEQELSLCIDAGIPGKQIVANGPKSRGFLRAAIAHDCLIAVNSLSELECIGEILDQDGSSQQVRVMLRVTTPGSRFGLAPDLLRGDTGGVDTIRERISIVGLSFHSDTISVEDKASSIKRLVELQGRLSAQGHEVSHLSIGGGYRVQYCASPQRDQSPREYYQGAGQYGVDFLDELLHVDIDGQSFSEYLLESFTTLIVEPGRSLLDQSGILVHTVIDVNDAGIVIDGNIYSTGAIAQEMPHDPLFVSSQGSLIDTSDGESTLGYIYGNLCLESDRIYSRQIRIPESVNVGDHLIIVNTSGYFADFSDSQPIGHTDRITRFM